MKIEAAVNLLPRRKRNRLPADRYLGKCAYFVTICTQGRESVLDSPALVEKLRDLMLKKCEQSHFSAYAYCFMPDHLHLEIIGTNEAANLQAVVRAFKGASAAVARGHGIHRLWQKGFYEHNLRSNEGLDAVAWYIFNNPVRAGLIQDWTKWPFSGSAIIAWKKMNSPLVIFVPHWKIPERATFLIR